MSTERSHKQAGSSKRTRDRAPLVSRLMPWPTARWARAGVAVLGIGVLAAGAVLLLAPTKRNQAVGYEDTCTDPPPEPGPARPWEVDIGVSTYSSANTRSGNLFTAIPIIGWSGKGPDMNMVLYHNSANVDQPGGWTDNVGFDLGPGWTIAYSDQLKLNLPDEVTVVYDDGTEDVFTWNETTEEWDPPPGVHDVLTFDNDVWRVTHKDQSAMEFIVFQDDIPRLIRRIDSVGSVLAIAYENGAGGGPIETITDASGRELEFIYDQAGKLTEIRDPDESSSAGCGTSPDRSWELYYDQTSGWLSRIVDPLGNRIDIDYDEDGRIETITDKYEDGEFVSDHTWEYEYFPTGGSSLDYPGRIMRVEDPYNRDQEFATVCFDDEFFYTSYFNRRGLEWQYLYFHPGDGSNPWFPSGNISVIVPPGETTGDGWWWDADRNVTEAADAMSRGWVADYDDRGNMTDRWDSYEKVESWEYDDYNNVLSYTNQLGKTTEFEYEQEGYPTLLTAIIEPADGQGSSTATTTLEYHTSGDGIGQVKKVTDANGVITTFDYDPWGQLRYYREGEVVISQTVFPVYCEKSCTDGAGRVTSTGQSCEDSVERFAGGGGFASYNSLNQQTGSSCIAYAAGAYATAELSMMPKLPSNPVEVRRVSGSFAGAEYSPRGRLETMPASVHIQDTLVPIPREFEYSYDRLQRATSSLVDSEESGSPVSRAFAYSYQHGTSPNETDFWIVRTGPDDLDTVYEFNDRDLVSKVYKGPVNDPIYSAEYAYYDNGLVQRIDYSNDTSANYEYDGNNRVTEIDHRDDGQASFLILEYTYTDTNLPETITETRPEGWSATTEYTYDDRSRLIKEERTGDEPYLFSYEYDQGGNRTKKKYDASGTGNDRRYIYKYDNAVPTTYLSKNNRLMQVDEHQGLSMGQLLSSTWYYYNGFGNITYIVTGAPGGSQQSMMGGGSEEESSSQEESMESEESSLEEPGGGGESLMASFECQTGDPYEAVRFEYAANGRTVIYAIHEQWCWTGDAEEDPTEYQVNHVEHYRYDAARQRYLVQVLDPDDPDITDPSKVLSERWSDYDADNVYGDFIIDEGNPISTRSFEPGVALVTDIDDEGDLYTEYYHADHLGTTMANSDSDATATNAAVFTAFGERRFGSVTGPAERYGYVGAHGYQAHEYAPFTFMHVGARYYDPASGRFLQRDPIGILGGKNVYGYVRSQPTFGIDSSGLFNDNSSQPLFPRPGQPRIPHPSDPENAKGRRPSFA